MGYRRSSATHHTRQACRTACIVAAARLARIAVRGVVSEDKKGEPDRP